MADLGAGRDQIAPDHHIARQIRAIREYHVYFVRTRRHSGLGFAHCHIHIGTTVGEIGHGGNFDRAIRTQRLVRHADKARINAHRCGMTERRHCVRTQLANFLVGVVVLQTG